MWSSLMRAQLQYIYWEWILIPSNLVGTFKITWLSLEKKTILQKQNNGLQNEILINCPIDMLLPCIKLFFFPFLYIMKKAEAEVHKFIFYLNFRFYSTSDKFTILNSHKKGLMWRGGDEWFTWMCFYTELRYSNKSTLLWQYFLYFSFRFWLDSYWVIFKTSEA